MIFKCNVLCELAFMPCIMVRGELSKLNICHEVCKWVLAKMISRFVCMASVSGNNLCSSSSCMHDCVMSSHNRWSMKHWSWVIWSHVKLIICSSRSTLLIIPTLQLWVCISMGDLFGHLFFDLSIMKVRTCSPLSLSLSLSLSLPFPSCVWHIWTPCIIIIIIIIVHDFNNPSKVGGSSSFILYICVFHFSFTGNNWNLDHGISPHGLV